MATLEDLRVRLMQPAKDLADWNFPFAETLEEYHNLLKQEQDLNLNKDSLVLQNSANTHVRRIEYLFQDVSGLIQTFVDKEASNEDKQKEKNNGKEKKTVIEILDFEPIDFAQYIGKNVNMRNRNSSVKLLGQRFPELEIVSRPISSNDFNSTEDPQDRDHDQEDIGKKYNFRCNQYITASGMLVEHLTPKDCLSICSLEPSENIVGESFESGVYLNTSVESDESQREIDSVFAADIDSDLHPDRCVASTPFPQERTDFMSTTSGSVPDSGRGSSPLESTCHESSLLIDQGIDHGSVTPCPSSTLFNDDFHCSAKSIDRTNPKSDETTANISSPSKRCAEERDNSTDCSSTTGENFSTSGNTTVVQQCRRSKRLRCLFDTDEVSKSTYLEPIPFDIVPDKLPKSRAEFKLPCHISLLKCKGRPRKRKITSEAQKKRTLEKFLLTEAEMGNKKMSIYSPTRQLYFPLMKEELESLPEFIDKHLRDRQNIVAIEYEAVTNNSQDLLGYKTNDHKPNSLEYEVTSTSDVATTLMPGSPCPDTMDDFPMPDTPESFNSPEPATPITPPLIYSSRIEQSVRDIYDDTDIRTEQDEAVIKWHKQIQPKLREIGRRPAFEMGEYTARILRSLKNDKNGSMTFDTMVRQHRPSEAARYLLASLQLANTYNLHIDTNNDEGNVTLVLLKGDTRGND